MIRHKQIQEANGMLQLLIDILADNGQNTIATQIEILKTDYYDKFEKQLYEEEKKNAEDSTRGC